MKQRGGATKTAAAATVTEATTTTTNGNHQSEHEKDLVAYAQSGKRIQLAILGSLLLPYLLVLVTKGTAPFVELYGALHIGKFVENPIPADKGALARLVLLLISLSTPQSFYYWLWTRPQSWISICGRYGIEPFKGYAYSAHLIKVQQTICFSLWLLGTEGCLYVIRHPNTSMQLAFEYLGNLPLLQILLGFQLAFLGQIFNVGVYSTIGEDGVYYGVKFGRKIPWVYGFPFNVLNHPQYRGATITIWGIVVLLASANTVARGIYDIGIVWSLYYLFSGAVEQYL